MIPTAFISYSWDSDELKEWIKKFATELRSDGIDVKLDQWEAIPGDQLPHFMEKSIRENDYVLIVCTPNYIVKSDNRTGGVGYEGDIMTAEVIQSQNHRKFIPLLKEGTKETALPSWLKGKYFIDFTTQDMFEKSYNDIITTIYNEREKAPPLGKRPIFKAKISQLSESANKNELYKKRKFIEEQKRKKEEQHRKNIDDISGRLKFD